MKGMIFKHFLEYAESTFGLDFVDDLINKASSTDGVYLSFANYPTEELVALLSTTSEEKNLTVGRLLENFGVYTIPLLLDQHPHIRDVYNHPLDLIEGVEHHIHEQVMKLYTGLSLPTFMVVSRTDNQLVMEYTSPRDLPDLALGFIKGTLKYFKTEGIVETEKVTTREKTTKFTIKLLE